MISSRLSFVALGCLLISTCSASAQEAQVLRVLNTQTLKRSVQCELGIFGTQVARGISGDRLNAKVVLTKEIKTTGSFGFDIKAIFIAIGGGVAQENIRTIQQTVTFKNLNIDSANRQACRDRNNIALLDLRSCLKEGADTFRDGDISCLSQVNATETVSANGGIPVYVVTIGPKASYETSFVRGIQVIAPRPRG